MQTNPINANFRGMSAVLRGETDLIIGWIRQPHPARIAFHLGIILAGAGAYGAAVGCWRAPEQALFTGVKLPLIILLTTLGNGLLNGMLAPLLGVNMSFRQSLQAVLMSFMIAGTILGSFSPIAFFLVWNVPPMGPTGNAVYPTILLTHVLVIAFAGVASNLRLAQLLRQLGGSHEAGRRVLFAWLAGNLLLGSQLSWILRPFIGAPELPVEFLRKTAFDGNFFEAVLHALQKIL